MHLAVFFSEMKAKKAEQAGIASLSITITLVRTCDTSERRTDASCNDATTLPKRNRKQVRVRVRDWAVADQITQKREKESARRKAMNAKIKTE